ncbi:unnamed protein product [Penicillium roqueforti FM164]|uniref:Genomic scaffold, ProqFM164S04 n=1 Tax=Penicillium roqueforti (strain FM164) TaxID=1365484 RepID=W6QI41_PENRF|nr:unnamed protein product [Penicillium roqueforti FM164]
MEIRVILRYSLTAFDTAQCYLSQVRIEEMRLSLFPSPHAGARGYGEFV